MAETDDEFAAYFRSDLHNKRMLEARQVTEQRLSALGRHDFLSAFSDAIGTVYGVGQFYRSLGLKHQGAKVFTAVFQWMKKGTD